MNCIADALLAHFICEAIETIQMDWIVFSEPAQNLGFA